ncbi:tRNA pseudouridine synthase A [Geodia barretti]|uniref:tRNA pseudouridine synthase A n=1 Tax=Geodia barretti TaxID=519541 RepID=A0AA35X072_GEOBA|nr:tRNA pseudouridine synthase A [Geodia barretti]
MIDASIKMYWWVTQVFFDAYNKKFGSDGSHEALDWKECTERVEEFKRQFIHQNIIDTDIDEMSMMQWLGSLQIHDFYSTKQRLLSAQRSEEELLIKGAEPPVGKEKTGTKEDTKVSEESSNDV